MNTSFIDVFSEDSGWRKARISGSSRLILLVRYTHDRKGCIHYFAGSECGEVLEKAFEDLSFLIPLRILESIPCVV
jgi:hypothetical protein